jgi:addiction module RelE/StbE family toxin
MLTPDYTGQFKKDYKLAMKRGLDIGLLDSVIVGLVNERPLDEKRRDHPLTGNWSGRRECHIIGGEVTARMKYEIGNRIRAFREAQKLSQKDFARLIGVKNSRVSNWEQGINRPDVDVLAKICSVLKVSADELIDVRLSEYDLNEQEKKIIMQYRRKPALQQAIRILLGLETTHDD